MISWGARIANLDQQIQFLNHETQGFSDRTNGVVRWLSDRVFSSNRDNQHAVHEELRQAHDWLEKAKQSEDARDLETAVHHMDRAQNSWGRYLKTTQYGFQGVDGLVTGLGLGGTSGVLAAGLTVLAGAAAPAPAIFGGVVFVGMGAVGFFSTPQYEPALNQWNQLLERVAQTLRSRNEDNNLSYAWMAFQGEEHGRQTKLDFKKVHAKYEEDVAQLKARVQGSAEDPEWQVQQVRDYLLPRYLDKYIRDRSYVSGFYNEKDPGGNCVAEALLLIAAIKDSNIRLNPPQALGLQVFSTHVQAVVYNRSTGETWNILSGEKMEKVRGKIYSPLIFLHAFLKKQGVGSPVKEDDLLLASEEKRDHLWGKIYLPEVDPVFDFPGGMSAYSDAEIPERTIINVPLYSTSAHRPGALPTTVNSAWSLATSPALGSSSGGLGVSGPSGQDETEEEAVTKIELFLFSDMPADTKTLLGDRLKYANFAYKAKFQGPWSVYFREAEDQAQYLKIPESDRRSFLQMKSRQAYASLFVGAAFDQAMDLLVNPERVGRYSRDELGSMTVVIHAMHDAYYDTGDIHRWLPFDKNSMLSPEKIHGRPELGLRFLEADNFFHQWAENNPEKLLSFLEVLGEYHRNVLPLVQTQTTYRWESYDKNIRIQNNLVKLLEDPAKVSIGLTGKNESWLQEEMEVEYLAPLESPRGDPVVQIPLLPVQPLPKPRSTSQGAAVHISAELAFDILEKFGFQYPSAKRILKSRWTTQLSEQLIKTDLGKLKFLHLYQVLVPLLPAHEVTEPNPYYDASRERSPHPQLVSKDIANLLIRIKEKK